MSWNLGPLAVVSWTWRALRGHSVTFAALFALGVLGLPVVTGFRHVLARLEAPWYVWLLVPIFAVGFLARKETQWMPEAEVRKKWARRIFFGSIVLALLLAKFGRTHRHDPAPEEPNAAAPK